jgi:uncharacterized protein (DUF2062 family)
MATKFRGPLSAAFARIKHMRRQLHRQLGDRLFALEMWQPSAHFASECAIGVFFSMMPLPFQMLAAALIAYLARVNIPGRLPALG